MTWKGLILVFFILWLTAIQSYGQSPAQPLPLSNLRVKKIAVTKDSTRIDSLSIIPKTLSITGVPTEDFFIDNINSVLIWKQVPSTDSVLVRYRVFPYRLNEEQKRYNFDSVSYRFYVKPYEPEYGTSADQTGIFDFGTIEYNGSLGRQISFGNNQDAVVNSDLNLTINGFLGDSIELTAAITDSNIPIQPDGNTQQLNEFDRVFLQFKKKNWQLSLGDIDIRQNKSYFLNFYKRLQGVAFETKNKLSDAVSSSTLVSGSIAKGKFTRNIFQGLEGNQGPYRLTGANNEFFFIVLPNTERVFIDGELLQRGEDQDYVINYNTAEVTFTPKRMITKDSRIQIEFEYADRNFLNSNLYGSQEIEINKKWNLRVGAFKNSDAKNSSVNQTLDPAQKLFLSTVGDSIQNAYYSSAVLDTVFDAGKILYEKQYYNNGTNTDSFYVYSTDPALAKYSLSFTFVGQGNGNYVPEFNGANGKVFKFITPVGGVKQGSYEPVSILVTPKKQQMLSVGADYNSGKNTILRSELAMSTYDVNTFSKINDGDDNGLAIKLGISQIVPFNNSGEKKIKLTADGDIEFVQKQFKPLERLRQVEFSREWGLSFLPLPADELIAKIGAKIQNAKDHIFNYQFTSYTRSDNYRGARQAITHKGNLKGWQFNNQFSITNFNNNFDKGSYLKPGIDISKSLKKLSGHRLGFSYTSEQNAPRNIITDTLTPLSFSFDVYSAYIKSSEAKQNTRYGLTFFTRSDKYASGKDFVRGDRSYNINFETALEANEHHKFYFNTTFRKLKVLDPVSRQTDDETILGRAEYKVNEWKGLLDGYVLYELGTGQEQKRDFTYVEVQPGQGEYAWIDYNNDGVQQLNEFEVALYPDQAKFIRLFVPTNQFVKANYITFNYFLNLNPRSLLSGGGLKGVKKLVSKINLQSSVQITRKSISGGGFQFDPFKLTVADTALITLSQSLLNTFSFNRFSSKWGFDISNRRDQGKSLLTYGYESRRLNNWDFKTRWNISRSFSLNITGKNGIQGLFTPNANFTNRNYELKNTSIEPVFAFIKGTNFRLQTGYKYENKKNRLDIQEAVSNSINIETKYNALQNTSVTAKFTYNSISYNDVPNTTVSYIMLDGLLPGSNYLWTMEITKRLLKNLELTIQYDGRRPASARTVHRGTAGVRALF